MRCTATRSACSARTRRRPGRSCAPSCPAPTRVEVLRARRRRARSAGCEMRADSGLFQGVGQRARAVPAAHHLAGRACRRPRTPIRSARCSATSTCTCSTKAATSSSRRRSAPMSMTIDGVRGTRFAVWAPNARRVAVVGDFNAWDARRHPMRLRHGAGVWELFVPRVGRRRALQVRDRRRRAASRAAEGRSGGAADRTAARHRLGRGQPRAVPLARRRMDAHARRAPRAGRAALDLRGASRRPGCGRARRRAHRRCGTSRSTG